MYKRQEEDSHLGDFIPDDDAPAPAEAASYTLLKEQLVNVLSTLTPREEKVLKLRFGLEDGRARTLEEVGKEFNVTRERIRQIEAKALRKLRPVSYTHLDVYKRQGQGVPALLAALERELAKRMHACTVLLPFSEGQLLDRLHRGAQIEREEYLPEGVRLTLTVDDALYNRISRYLQ